MRKLLFVALGVVTLFSSCIRIVTRGVRGEGEVVMECRTFDTSGVNALSVSSGFDVILDSSVEPGVVQVSTYENILEYVKIDVDNGSLNIEMRGGVFCDVDVLEVRLSPAEFNVFVISGGVDMTCVEPLNTSSDVIFAISGGADVELGLSCDNLTIAASGGADVCFDKLDAKDIKLAASGGADVEFIGSCTTLNVEVSGGADSNLRDLQAVHVVANASGGADLAIWATGSYEICASGAADVWYRNTGATVVADSSGGADVKRAK